MTDQKIEPQPINQTPIRPQVDVQSSTSPQIEQPVQTVNEGKKNKFGDLFREVFSKIAANKKLVILLITVGTIFALVIIFGVIFKLIQGSKQGAAVATPSPEATPQIILTEESKTNELRLKQLKENIEKIDVNQRYLTPPDVEFEVSF